MRDMARAPARVADSRWGRAARQLLASAEGDEGPEARAALAADTFDNNTVENADADGVPTNRKPSGDRDDAGVAENGYAGRKDSPKRLRSDT